MLKQTTPAVALSEPTMRTVRVPETGEEAPHLGYDAEIQYVRKPPQVRLILCSEIDDVEPGEPVLLTYHRGLQAYQHARHVSVSSPRNCLGGFYYTNGEEA